MVMRQFFSNLRLRWHEWRTRRHAREEGIAINLQEWHRRDVRERIRQELRDLNNRKRR
jgi:hypothetical protein